MIPELLIMLGLSGAKWCDRALTPQTEPDEWGVFIDGNGNYRLYPSLKQVYYGYTSQDEYALWYINGTVALNIDLLKSRQYEEQAIKDKKEFYLRTPRGRLGNHKISGARYCRVKHPNIYYVKKRLAYDNEVTNEYYYGDFYMDMNYRLICASDETKEKDKQEYGIVRYDMQHKIIEMFNKKTENRDNIFVSLMNYNDSYVFKVKAYEKYKNQLVTKNNSMPF